MTLLVLSDDDAVRHNLERKRVDVLISCGDMTDNILLQIAKAVQCSCIFAVKGNHDSRDPFLAPITDLHLAVQTLGGLRLGGFNGSWRYKPRGHYLYEQSEVERLLRTFPPVDVFVAHNSPRHIHDRDDNVHLGFEAFVDYIHRVHPRLFLHGHQRMNQETRIGGTRVIGVYGQKQLEIQTK
jgi:Icc-related predicted phosphoesterase